MKYHTLRTVLAKVAIRTITSIVISLRETKGWLNQTYKTLFTTMM